MIECANCEHEYADTLGECPECGESYEDVTDTAESNRIPIGTPIGQPTGLSYRKTDRDFGNGRSALRPALPEYYQEYIAKEEGSDKLDEYNQLARDYDVSWHVKKMDEEKGGWYECDTIRGEMSPEVLRKTWGHGRFSIQPRLKGSKRRTMEMYVAPRFEDADEEAAAEREVERRKKLNKYGVKEDVQATPHNDILAEAMRASNHRIDKLLEMNMRPKEHSATSNLELEKLRIEAEIRREELKLQRDQFERERQERKEAEAQRRMEDQQRRDDEKQASMDEQRKREAELRAWKEQEESRRYAEAQLRKEERDEERRREDIRRKEDRDRWEREREEQRRQDKEMQDIKYRLEQAKMDLDSKAFLAMQQSREKESQLFQMYMEKMSNQESGMDKVLSTLKTFGVIGGSKDDSLSTALTLVGQIDDLRKKIGGGGESDDSPSSWKDVLSKIGSSIIESPILAKAFERQPVPQISGLPIPGQSMPMQIQYQQPTPEQLAQLQAMQGVQIQPGQQQAQYAGPPANETLQPQPIQQELSPVQQQIAEYRFDEAEDFIEKLVQNLLAGYEPASYVDYANTFCKDDKNRAFLASIQWQDFAAIAVRRVPVCEPFLKLPGAPEKISAKLEEYKVWYIENSQTGKSVSSRPSVQPKSQPQPTPPLAQPMPPSAPQPQAQPKAQAQDDNDNDYVDDMPACFSTWHASNPTNTDTMICEKDANCDFSDACLVESNAARREQKARQATAIPKTIEQPKTK
ncbi:MAG: hypothetical protein Q8O94_02645 [bacterium]|nr:hypothetical protein [bacterium]